MTRILCVRVIQKKDHCKCYERCTKQTLIKTTFLRFFFYSKNDMFFSFLYRLLFYTCTRESVTIDFLSIKFVTCYAYFVYQVLVILLSFNDQFMARITFF